MKQTLSWIVPGAGGQQTSRNKQQQGEILPALLGWTPAFLVYTAQGSWFFL